MKRSITLTLGLAALAANNAAASSDYTLLMYKDSSFEDYVGQLAFDTTDRCYSLCVDQGTVSSFVWDGIPKDATFLFFGGAGCEGTFVTGPKKDSAEFSLAATGLSHKVSSFMLTRKGTATPTKGIVRSCDEPSDLVYKPNQDTTSWT
ncbi:hypothetical protein BBJ28_00015238 [Nothophytophthora sp. Chile5]|nr:hypothetical protein BBJ28_00027162 [Nothophytophthora sp. Chile5]RLN73576.1 hypothetical protein BBJ28_00015238 [Nothophytophthora sp. Chile5]